MWLILSLIPDCGSWRDRGGVVFVLVIQQEHRCSGKTESLLKNCLHQDWPVDTAMGACSLLLVDIGGLSPLWAVLPLGRWAWAVKER